MEWVAGGRASKAFAQAEPCASGETERERVRLRRTIACLAVPAP